MALAAMLARRRSARLRPKDKEKVPCSVCGYHDSQGRGAHAEYEGMTYYFCEAGCKAYFLMDPAAMAAGMDMDPVCGMTVKKAGSIEAVHNGRQMHFCANACKDKYFANPAEYEINYDVVSNEVKPQKEMKHTVTFEGRPFSFVSEANKSGVREEPRRVHLCRVPRDREGVPAQGCAVPRSRMRGRRAISAATVVSRSSTRIRRSTWVRRRRGRRAAARRREMKKAEGAKKEAGCAAAEAGACPKAKTCKDGKK